MSRAPLMGCCCRLALLKSCRLTSAGTWPRMAASAPNPPQDPSAEPSQATSTASVSNSEERHLTGPDRPFKQGQLNNGCSASLWWGCPSVLARKGSYSMERTQPLKARQTPLEPVPVAASLQPPAFLGHVSSLLWPLHTQIKF